MKLLSEHDFAIFVCLKVHALPLVTLVDVAQVAHVEDHLLLVLVTLHATYFVIVVVMSHLLVNQVSSYMLIIM